MKKNKDLLLAFLGFFTMLVAVGSLLYNTLTLGDKLLGKNYGPTLLTYFLLVSSFARGRWANYLVVYPGIIVSFLAIVLGVKWGFLIGPLFPIALYFYFTTKIKLVRLEKAKIKDKEKQSEETSRRI